MTSSSCLALTRWFQTHLNEVTSIFLKQPTTFPVLDFKVAMGQFTHESWLSHLSSYSNGPFSDPVGITTPVPLSVMYRWQLEDPFAPTVVTAGRLDSPEPEPEHPLTGSNWSDMIVRTHRSKMRKKRFQNNNIYIYIYIQEPSHCERVPKQTSLMVKYGKQTSNIYHAAKEMPSLAPQCPWCRHVAWPGQRGRCSQVFYCGCFVATTDDWQRFWISISGYQW